MDHESGEKKRKKVGTPLAKSTPAPSKLTEGFLDDFFTLNFTPFLEGTSDSDDDSDDSKVQVNIYYKPVNIYYKPVKNVLPKPVPISRKRSHSKVSSSSSSDSSSEDEAPQPKRKPATPHPAKKSATKPESSSSVMGRKDQKSKIYSTSKFELFTINDSLSFHNF